VSAAPLLAEKTTIGWAAWLAVRELWNFQNEQERRGRTVRETFSGGRVGVRDMWNSKDKGHLVAAPWMWRNSSAKRYPRNGAGADRNVFGIPELWNLVAYFGGVHEARRNRRERRSAVTGTEHDDLCEHCGGELTCANLVEGDLGFYCCDGCREGAESYGDDDRREYFHSDI
jgi:hypothetical protein